jgi:hypothetical protein
LLMLSMTIAFLAIMPTSTFTLAGDDNTSY